MKRRRKAISKSITVECLFCGDFVAINKGAKMGSIVICQSCKSSIILKQATPLRLEWHDGDEFLDEDEYYPVFYEVDYQ